MAVPEIRIKIGADTAPLDQGLRGAQDSVTRFARAAEATSTGVGTVFERAGGTVQRSMRDAAGAAIREIASIAGPAALAAAAIGGIFAAVKAYISSVMEETPKIDEALKVHADLIKSLKTAYGEAIVGLDEYAKQTDDSFRNRLGASISVLQAQLQGLGQNLVDQFATVLPSINMVTGQVEEVGSTFLQLPAKLEPFRGALEALHESVRAGNPDFVSFKNEVDRIGAAAAGTNPEVNRTAVALAEAARQGYQAQQGIGAATSAMSQLAPEARKAAAAVEAYNAALKSLDAIAPKEKTDRFKTDEAYLTAIFNAAGDENKIRQAVQARNDAIRRIEAEEAEKNAKKGGATDNTDWEAEAERAKLESKLEILRKHLLSKDELMNENFIKNQQLIEEAANKEIITEQQKLAMLAQLNADYLAKKEAMDDAVKTKALKSTAEMFGSLASLSESFGKKNTAISKAFGIAQALINTYVGATEALKLPPPANFAAFAAVMAKGLAAVAAITAVNTSGKGGNAPRAVGGGSGAGGGTSQQAAPDQAGKSMYVTLNGDIFNREMVRGLLEQISSFQKDGGGKVVFG